MLPIQWAKARKALGTGSGSQEAITMPATVVTALTQPPGPGEPLAEAHRLFAAPWWRCSERSGAVEAGRCYLESKKMALGFIAFLMTSKNVFSAFPKEDRRTPGGLSSQ